MRTLTLLLLTVLLTLTTAACQRSLFDDRASRRAQIDRYYEGDSAYDTTSNRRRSSDMGFGFPTGLGGQ
jgi:hypothetical protein